MPQSGTGSPQLPHGENDFRLRPRGYSKDQTACLYVSHYYGATVIYFVVIGYPCNYDYKINPCTI